MKKNNKGFTLAELLIVVAIIAVLVAVSIPIFTGQLSNAKKNTDAANLRAAKAAAVAQDLSTPNAARVYYYNAKTGAVADKADGIEAYGLDGSAKDKIVVVKITDNTVDADWN